MAKLLCCWMFWGSFKLAANLLLAFKSLLVCMCLVSCCQNHLLPQSRLDVQFLHATFHLRQCRVFPLQLLLTCSSSHQQHPEGALSSVYLYILVTFLSKVKRWWEAGLDLAGWPKRGRCSNTSKLNVVHQSDNNCLDGPVPAPSKGLAMRRVKVVWHKDVKHNPTIFSFSTF